MFFILLFNEKTSYKQESQKRGVGKCTLHILNTAAKSTEYSITIGALTSMSFAMIRTITRDRHNSCHQMRQFRSFFRGLMSKRDKCAVIVVVIVDLYCF